jgi:hypothetical protein
MTARDRQAARKRLPLVRSARESSVCRPEYHVPSAQVRLAPAGRKTDTTSYSPAVSRIAFESSRRSRRKRWQTIRRSCPPYVEGRQQEGAHYQIDDQSAYNHDRKRALGVRSNGMGKRGRQQT